MKNRSTPINRKQVPASTQGMWRAFAARRTTVCWCWLRATPSVESYYYAQKGVYHLITLKNRYGGALLPNVEVVDMGQELRGGNDSQLSRELLVEMQENLQNKEQTILLLNRRGYHTRAICTGCNTAASCPNCSIAMTYHAANGRLMCHYCGYSRPADERCRFAAAGIFVSGMVLKSGGRAP